MTKAIVPALLLFAGQAFATDLRVTDGSSTTTLIHDAYIDYGSFMNDKEYDGIRVYQGDAVVTAKWTNIQSLTITGKETSQKPGRVTVDIVLKKGGKVPATLLTKGRMHLVGKTELGDYFIDLDKLRTIAPVPEQSKRQ